MPLHPPPPPPPPPLSLSLSLSQLKLCFPLTYKSSCQLTSAPALCTYPGSISPLSWVFDAHLSLSLSPSLSLSSSLSFSLCVSVYAEVNILLLLPPLSQLKLCFPLTYKSSCQLTSAPALCTYPGSISPLSWVFDAHLSLSLSPSLSLAGALWLSLLLVGSLSLSFSLCVSVYAEVNILLLLPPLSQLKLCFPLTYKSSCQLTSAPALCTYPGSISPLSWVFDL